MSPLPVFHVHLTGPRRIRAAGVTLVELLVAVAVFALLATASVTLLAHVLDQRAVVSAQSARLAQLQRTHALLGADLSQVALRRVRRADGSSQRSAFMAAPAGTGEGELFAFVRRGWANADGDPRASLQYVQYRVEDGRLLRSARQYLDGAVDGEPHLLLDGVRSARVAYFGHGQWSDGWDGGVGRLPDAVALELELERYGHVRQVFVLPGGGA